MNRFDYFEFMNALSKHRDKMTKDDQELLSCLSGSFIAGSLTHWSVDHESVREAREIVNRVNRTAS